MRALHAIDSRSRKAAAGVGTGRSGTPGLRASAAVSNVRRLRGEISSMREGLTLTKLRQLSFGHVTDSITIEAFAR